MTNELMIIAKWLESTRLSHLMAGGWMWGWAICETIHFIGLCLLLGCIGVLDLRMLGLAKTIPIDAVHKLVPWGVLGFVLNLITGVLFFIGAPSQYVNNTAFWFKMLFLLIAGLNVMIFYLSGLLHKMEELGPNEDAPMSAKVISGVSIASWFMVLYWGRMLPFVGNAF